MRERLREPALGFSILHVMLGVFVLTPGAAWAQQPRINGEFTVQRFDPAPGPRNFFVTQNGSLRWEQYLECRSCL